MSVLRPGTVVDGFEVVSLLGKGGMGAVYRVRRDGGEYALKTLTFLGSPEAVVRFRREAQLVVELRHHAIVPVLGAGQAQGLLYFLMELVEGESLEARLKREGGLPPAEAARIVLEVADAIAFAHERGIVHRDLKPGNILLENGTGRVLVTDFGLARRIDDQEGLTATGEVLGTPAYLAPEQALGLKGEIDERTDVYGLGVLLYAALAGHAPFKAKTSLDALKLVASEPPAPLEGLAPELQAVLARAMAKKREDRFASAGAFADALAAAGATAERTLPVSPFAIGLSLAALVTAVLTIALVLTFRPHATARILDAASPGDLDAALERTRAADLEGTRAWLLARGEAALDKGEWPVAAHRFGHALRLAGPSEVKEAIAPHELTARTLAAIAAGTAAIATNDVALGEFLARTTRAQREGRPVVLGCEALYERALRAPDAEALLFLLDARDVPPGRQGRAVGQLWLEKSLTAFSTFDWDRSETPNAVLADLGLNVDDVKARALQLAPRHLSDLGKGDPRRLVNALKAEMAREIPPERRVANVRKHEPIVARLARAVRADPAITPFPVGLRRTFDRLRVGIETGVLGERRLEESWEDAFRSFPDHPVHQYARVRIALGSTGSGLTEHTTAAAGVLARLPEDVRAAGEVRALALAFARLEPSCFQGEPGLEALATFAAIANWKEGWRALERIAQGRGDGPKTTLARERGQTSENAPADVVDPIGALFLKLALEVLARGR